MTRVQHDEIVRDFVVVSASMITLLLWMSDIFGISSLTYTIHILYVLFLYPIVMILSCLFLISSRDFGNFAVQSWSHSRPMESKPVVFISENRCFMRAYGDSVGIFK